MLKNASLNIIERPKWLASGRQKILSNQTLVENAYIMPGEPNISNWQYFWIVEILLVEKIQNLF